MDDTSGDSGNFLSANAAKRHIEAQLGPAPRILSGDLAAWATAESPPWLSPDDEVSQIFQHRKETIRRGVVRWAAVVQANQTIFYPGPIDNGAQVVFAPQDNVPVSDLSRIAKRILALKGTRPADPDERKLADMISDEHERALDWAIPSSLTDGLFVVTTIVILPRADTPGRLLANNVFPILVDVSTSLSLFVPGQYWPPGLREFWEAKAAATSSGIQAAREARRAAVRDAVERGDVDELGLLGDASLLVRLTDAAGQRLRELVVLQGKHACALIAVRVGKNGSRRYSIKFADRRSLGDDYASYTSSQVAIAIDVAHAELLADVTLDFLSTPDGTRFRFDSPTDDETTLPASPGKKCPGCGDLLAEGAVLCIACGFDTRTGRKLATNTSRSATEHIAQLRITRKAKRGLTEPEEQVYEAWLRAIRPVIEDYLAAHAGSCRLSGELEIVVTEFRCEISGLLQKSFNRAVRLSISGRVAGSRKTVQLRRKLQVAPPTAKQAVFHSMFGILTGDNMDEDMETIRSVVYGDLDPATLTSGTLARDPFYAAVSTSLIEKLDTLLGRDNASSVRWWRFIRVLVAPISIAIGIATWLHFGNAPPPARGFLTLLSLVAASGISYAAGACLMPASFFENYGAGQRLMHFAGTETGKSTLVTLRTATLCAIVGMGALFYALWEFEWPD